jgi:hypothetical protein
MIFPFLDRVICHRSRPVPCSFAGGLMSRGVVIRCRSGRSRAIFGAAKGSVPRAALPVFEAGCDQGYLVFCGDYLCSMAHNRINRLCRQDDCSDLR